CNGYPIVLKPEESGGSDGVTICNNEQSATIAFNNILNARNKLGFLNNAILVEEYLEGKEYLINSVSHKGIHYITDYGFSNREVTKDGGIIYDSIDMLEPKGEAYDQIRDYYFKVLDALGIINSASHGEIKVDDKGPVLIEVGARLPGIDYPKLIESCIPYGPIQALADTYTHPERFIEKIKVDQHPKRLSKVIFLQSSVSGRLIDDLDFSFLNDLESFASVTLELHKGDAIDETQDLFSCPGFVMLVHEDPSVLKRDHQCIRRMEKEIYDKAVCKNP
ncbi:MAG: ATP-grasp domain-containing protein, partial [Chromatiaceae bacterium]|nr:ATP-grasp domain-containing protein [Chromatiaceae bacterium]